MASDTIFEMKHISDDARVAVVIFRKDNEEIEDTFLSASPEEFERVVHLIMLLRDFMRVSALPAPNGAEFAANPCGRCARNQRRTDT